LGKTYASVRKKQERKIQMRYYYYEQEVGYGEFKSVNDNEAKKRIPEFNSKKNPLLVLYRESDTLDGLPFVILYKKVERD
jgi:hypothetical protein